MTETGNLAAEAFAAPAEVAQPTGRYVLRYGAARTGRLYGRIDAADASGSAGMLGEGSVNVTVAAEQVGELYRSCPGAKGLWALEWQAGTDRRIVDAGVFWPRSFGEDSVTLGGRGILSILNLRLVIPNVAADQIAASPTITYSGYDTGTIMRMLVRQVMDMPRGDLPISLEPPRSGTRQQSYDGFDLAMAGQRLLELAGQEPNTEFLFVPRFVTGSTTQVVFDFVTGTEDQPQVTNTYPWRLTRAGSGGGVVGEVTVEDGADDLATDVYAAGAGDGKAKVIRAATDTTLTDAGFPRLDAVTTNDSASGSQVQRYASGDLRKVRRGTRGVDVDVSAQWWWSQPRRIGDLVRLRVANHRTLGSLDFTSRVASVSWQLSSPWVKVRLGDVLSEEGF